MRIIWIFVLMIYIELGMGKMFIKTRRDNDEEQRDESKTRIKRHDENNEFNSTTTEINLSTEITTEENNNSTTIIEENVTESNVENKAENKNERKIVHEYDLWKIINKNQHGNWSKIGNEKVGKGNRTWNRNETAIIYELPINGHKYLQNVNIHNQSIDVNKLNVSNVARTRKIKSLRSIEEIQEVVNDNNTTIKYVNSENVTLNLENGIKNIENISELFNSSIENPYTLEVTTSSLMEDDNYNYSYLQFNDEDNFTSATSTISEDLLFSNISSIDYENGVTTDSTTPYDENSTYSEEQILQEIREFITPKSWTWVLIFFHTVVFIIGLMGNTLVCIAVYRNHSMRTVTNYFIVNLAVADFLVILVCLPPTVIWDVTMTWFFGIYMCKIVLYLQGVSVTVSVLTLTFISIDRWYAICFPLKFKSTTGRAKTAIAIIWCLALIFDIPELIVYHTVQKLDNLDTIYFTQCEPNWTPEADNQWNILRSIFLYVVPLAFMCVTYFQIVVVLWRSGNTNQHGLDVGGNRQLYTFSMTTNTTTRSQLRSRKKAAKMLVAVVAMFSICYLPVHLFITLRVGMTNSDTNRVIALVSHWLCYANSAVNPIIYNFMSGKFRKEFKRSINCCSSSANRQPGYEMNSLHFQNTVRDSGVRSSRRNGTDIKRSDTLLTDLKT